MCSNLIIQGALMFKVEIKVNQPWYVNKKYLNPEDGWISTSSKNLETLKAAQIEAACVEDSVSTYGVTCQALKADLRILEDNSLIWYKQIF